MNGKINKRGNAVLTDLFCILLTAACGAAVLVGGLRLPLRQQQVLDLAWQQEVEGVQAVVGAILYGHPELEGEIAEILREGSADYRALGAQVLTRYGYHTNRPYTYSGRYRSLGQEMARHVRLLTVATILLYVLLWLWRTHREHERVRRTSKVLDSYLSGDFSFVETTPIRHRAGVWSSLEEDLRRLGGQVRLQQSRLEGEKEDTKALVTDISHQLKTPIAALKTCFSLYLEAEKPEERQEFQERCQLQMDKLEALTAALMNISRLESAMIQLQPELVDLRELLMDAVGGIFDKAADKNIAVELIPFEPVTLWLDRRWTTEALLNILDNAVKYSPPDSGIQIKVTIRQSFVRIEISDSGIGVPVEEQTSIFQRFFRGGHKLVRTSEGAGVGLYLTRTILEDQGGTIHVRSQCGYGATFVVQLFREL